MQRFREQNFDPLPLRGVPADYPLPEDMQRVLRYYEAHAPERLVTPEAWPAIDSTLKFVRHGLAPRGADPNPAISSVRFVDLGVDRRLELVATDMRHGLVLTGRPYDGSRYLEVVADARNPARIEVVDLDRDGVLDFLLADLGTFYPADHDKGSVVWLRGSDSGRYTPYEIGGFPRIADVQAADVDGDGDLDLIVAAFGLWTTGFVAVLENQTTDYAHPVFVTRKIDPRPGAIHVPGLDVNGDGRLDIVALISQQHESVVALLNQGPGKDFQPRTLYAAPHPAWGSSAMQLVDLDKDGDVDIVLANGDTFDDQLIKPYHGLQWLENTGSTNFVAHHLAGMPGVQSLATADLDGDGDIDIVATALLGQGGPQSTTARLPSIVWLEQTRPREFVKHTLEIGIPFHAAVAAADYDGDGDVDLAIGNFAAAQDMPASVDVWENVTKSRTQ
jgi:FG-GAP-like repeat